MYDLNDLYLFVQVVDYGGFTQASRVLGVPKSKLSRRTAALEERLGTCLIQRSTRHFSVTDIGRNYYAHCKAMLVEAEGAQEAVEVVQSGPRGIVRVTCPTALVDARIGAMLGMFMAENAMVEVHLESTNRRVDVITDAVDVAIRTSVSPPQESGLVVRALADWTLCLAASPEWVRRFGMPNDPGDLRGVPSLDLGSPRADHVWELYGPFGTRAEIRHRPRFITRSILALREAAVSGVGVVQLPHAMLRDDFVRGDLVQVLPTWAPQSETIHAVFSARRGLLPSVRGLIDFFAQQFECVAAG